MSRFEKKTRLRKSKMNQQTPRDHLLYNAQEATDDTREIGGNYNGLTNDILLSNILSLSQTVHLHGLIKWIDIGICDHILAIEQTVNKWKSELN